MLAPSHRSMMDIPFAAAVTTRRLRFMGKKSVFAVPVLGTLFRWLGGFPVARDGTDRKAVRDSVAMLEAGEVLCVYPEGNAPARPEDPAVAARCRVSRVARGRADRPGRGSRAPRRSCARTSDPIPRFGRVAIVVGPPIVPEARTTGVVARDKVDELTATLSDALQSLFDDAEELRNASPRSAFPSCRGWRASRRRRRRGRRRSGRPSAARGFRVAAERERRERVERGHELAQLGRRREVLVFVGDAHALDALFGREHGDHRVDELFRRARAGGHADDLRAAELIEIELVGTVDAQHDRTAGVARPSRARACSRSWRCRSPRPRRRVRRSR